MQLAGKLASLVSIEQRELRTATLALDSCKAFAEFTEGTVDRGRDLDP